MLMQAAKNIAFTGVALGSFGALLLWGIPQPSGQPAPSSSERLHTAHPLVLRGATALPATCDAAVAVNGVKGQLVRSGTARIVGLSDIGEVGYDPAGIRTCGALVNLAFGAQRVAYTIHRVAPGSKLWQIEVMAE